MQQAAKIVSKLLNLKQKQRCMDIAQVMLATFNDELGHNWQRIMGVCSLFSFIAMAGCIMNSCHTVVRSIRNTTLMLCADCVKQFVRNPQNYEKINHGFCTTITHKLIDRCLCVSFRPNIRRYRIYHYNPSVRITV